MMAEPRSTDRLQPDTPEPQDWPAVVQSLHTTPDVPLMVVGGNFVGPVPVRFAGRTARSAMTFIANMGLGHWEVQGRNWLMVPGRRPPAPDTGE